MSATIRAVRDPFRGRPRVINKSSQIRTLGIRIRILWELDVLYTTPIPSERNINTSCKECFKTLDGVSLIPIGKHRDEELGQAEQYIPHLVARKMYGAIRLRF